MAQAPQRQPTVVCAARKAFRNEAPMSAMLGVLLSNHVLLQIECEHK
jgi:hypothetical protein